MGGRLSSGRHRQERNSILQKLAARAAALDRKDLARLPRRELRIHLRVLGAAREEYETQDFQGLVNTVLSWNIATYFQSDDAEQRRSALKLVLDDDDITMDILIRSLILMGTNAFIPSEWQGFEKKDIADALYGTLKLETPSTNKSKSKTPAKSKDRLRDKKGQDKIRVDSLPATTTRNQTHNTSGDCNNLVSSSGNTGFTECEQPDTVYSSLENIQCKNVDASLGPVRDQDTCQPDDELSQGQNQAKELERLDSALEDFKGLTPDMKFENLDAELSAFLESTDSEVLRGLSFPQPKGRTDESRRQV